MRYLLLLLVYFGIIFPASAQSSVLAQGDFYSLEIQDDGLFKIDYHFLQQMGIDPQNVDPSTIRIYGNGGGMLPQSNQAARPSDLMENAIEVIAGGGDSFGSEDYLIFYAEGPHKTTYDSDLLLHYREHHLYSRSNYYYLTFGGTKGKRIEQQEHLEGYFPVINTYDALISHKLDSFNILSSGRNWYGERFNHGSQLQLVFPGSRIEPNSEVKAWLSVMSRSTGPSEFQLDLQGINFGKVIVPAAQTGTYGFRGMESVSLLKATINSTTEALEAVISYHDPKDSNGYLAELQLNFSSPLKLTENQVTIRSVAAMQHAVSQFKLQKPVDGLKVWNLQDIQNIQAVPVQTSDDIQSFSAPADLGGPFVLYRGNDFPYPRFAGKVSNQNLKEIQVPDMLIVTNDALKAEATRLAEFRRGFSNLGVEVVTTDQIYHEFSSGKLDVTAIRDFVRFLYLKDKRLKYLLLFGDASFDYKKIADSSAATVPAYQSRQSLHDIHSYVSDDYFGFLDEDEGLWSEKSSGESAAHDLDIGIGRLPVNSPEEAGIMVDKIIRYHTSPETLGNWRQQVVMVADDGEQNKFQLQSDFLTNSQERWPQYHAQRLYIDNYPKEVNGSVTRSPMVRNLLNNAVQEGALLVDFIGHGGETAWTNEQILDIQSIDSWRNQQRLPVFITATCEFGRYDDWKRASGAERLLLAENGGAAAVFTTARPMFINTNFDISRAFHEVFFLRDENGGLITLGDIMKYTKNHSVAGTVNRNFTLLGDPSMKVVHPRHQVVITTINQEQPPEVTIGPLSRVDIHGHIEIDGSMTDQFNGEIEVTLFDRQKEVSTLGQSDAGPMNYLDWQDIIFEGKAQVNSGRFLISFYTPADVSPKPGTGKFSLYARDAQTGVDAGAGLLVAIGGEGAAVNDDGIPPIIQIYLNEPGFKSGDMVVNTPRLFASFEDQHGINLFDSRGNGIELIVDDKPPVALSRYFESSPDHPGRGTLEYQLESLEPGQHQLTLAASDIFLNRTHQQISFQVGDDGALILSSFKAVPNPSFGAYTDFEFSYENALEEEGVGVLLNIYDNRGAQVKSIQRTFKDHPTGTHTMRWNHRSDGVKAGIYFYRFFLRSLQYAPGRRSGKILIIN